MKRALLAGVTLAAVTAAAGGGFIGVRGHLHLTSAATVGAGFNGLGAGERRTDLLSGPGRASALLADASKRRRMDATTAPCRRAPISASKTSRPPRPRRAVATDRKIKFYRNPMGLPDTSPTPKKDPMGMDYIPVYEGDDADDGSIKLSPGKIQRTGVKSEPAASRVIRTAIRAPGTIQLDERRVSVISMRSESWVQKVTNVTTGTRVTKGQPLMEIYSPLDLLGGGRIHRHHQFEDHRRQRRLWPRLAAAAAEPRRA